MNRLGRLIVLASLVAAFAVFLVVQDRITAAGARDYVRRQRAAATGQAPAVTIDEVMRPAVARSVRVGVLWGGVVLGVGLVVAISVGRQPDARAGDRDPSRR